MEEVQMALDEAKASNEKAIQHLISELEKIRAGKATPSLLDSVVVEYYVSQIA